MENENGIKAAYLYEMVYEKKCQFTFKLKVKVDNIVVDNEIWVERNLIDTAGSLLEKTSNKVMSILNKVSTVDLDEEKMLFKMNLWFRNGNKRQMVNTDQLITNLTKKPPSKLLFGIFNEQYRVHINTAIVLEVQLPPVLYTKCVIRPLKFRSLYINKNLSMFTWYKSTDKHNWRKVGDNYQYETKPNDAGFFLKLKCVPCSSKKVFGQPAEVISEATVQQMNVPTCPFEKRHAFTKEKLKGNKLRVVSYNTLSCRYSPTNEKMPYCSPAAMAIEYRRELLLKELSGYNADIICLQELDVSTYKGPFMNVLAKPPHSYSSIFYRKGNRISEGLACYFLEARFKSIKNMQFVFSQELESNSLFTNLWHYVKGKRELIEYFLKQATSFQVVILDELATKRILIVGNIHLFYHPNAEFIRLMQIHMATKYLKSIQKQYSKKGKDISIILCGDFNSSPKTSIYSYIVNGSTHKNDEVFTEIGKYVELAHPFKFISACGIPKYTNYTQSFKDCLDYIYVQNDKFQVVQVVPLPTEEELSCYEGLPNEVYPSDHLALVVDLELTTKAAMIQTD